MLPLPTTIWKDPSCLAPTGPSIRVPSSSTGSSQNQPSHMTCGKGIREGRRLTSQEDPPLRLPGRTCRACSLPRSAEPGTLSGFRGFAVESGGRGRAVCLLEHRVTPRPDCYTILEARVP